MNDTKFKTLPPKDRAYSLFENIKDREDFYYYLNMHIKLCKQEEFKEDCAFHEANT